VWKRSLIGVLSAYLLAALIGRMAESSGRPVCGCASDCWCKKPVLSLFRWVLPFGHSSLTPGEKAVLDSQH
jgi:hypothetical protein